jgi:hypothetical protein
MWGGLPTVANLGPIANQLGSPLGDENEAFWAFLGAEGATNSLWYSNMAGFPTPKSIFGRA